MTFASSRHNKETILKSVYLIVGTRPEAIKMAPLYRSLFQSDCLKPVLLSTGQHREMLAQTLGAFQLRPDIDLNLMQSNQTLPELTSRAILALSDTFEKNRPDLVLVQGDTTSVLAAAMAAFYHQVPVGHIEAGLRTGDLSSPFPEEFNRRLTSPICRFHFAPTDWSKANLLRESIASDRVFVTGNTVIDALLWMNQMLSEENRSLLVSERLKISDTFRDRYLHASSRDPFILVTAHRRESHGDGMENLCEAILGIVKENPNVGVLFPVHLNPKVRATILPRLQGKDRIELIDPAGYEDFVWMMSRCQMLISDSGGVQEEAPSLGKPVLVTRETTERPEGVQAGTCRLVGTNVKTILRETNILLQNKSEYEERSQLRNPYGDGTASDRIRCILESAVKTDQI
jgi:UDP-N-acetylglucosamine 2-epimerase (non-hydrolysing)